jgi:hypothetical protein
MARVKAPNGNVYDLEDAVASGLVGQGNRGYEYVKDEPKKSESKSTARKSSSEK